MLIFKQYYQRWLHFGYNWKQRFLLIKTTAIDVQTIKNDKNIIWGAAYQAFKQNEKYWLKENLLGFAETENKKRREDDVWIAIIQNRIGSDELTIEEDFQSCFEDIEASRIRQIDNSRMRQCFTKVRLWTGV